MKKYKGYLAFDFDAVISSYKRPFVLDKLGKPVVEVIETMRHYYNKGYYILIYTGRKYTKIMEKWLIKYKVPFHGFNINPKLYNDAHNYKPYYNVIIDDKGVNFDFRHNHKSKVTLIKNIEKILTASRMRENGK